MGSRAFLVAGDDRFQCYTSQIDTQQNASTESNLVKVPHNTREMAHKENKFTYLLLNLPIHIFASSSSFFG